MTLPEQLRDAAHLHPFPVQAGLMLLAADELERLAKGAPEPNDTADEKATRLVREHRAAVKRRRGKA
jgi:uncharacterized protein (DUF1697 family)